LALGASVFICGSRIPDKEAMRALSIRQPYAELILRGIKPIEFRSRPTTIIGERFYIYASQKWAQGKLFLEGCRMGGEGRSQNGSTLLTAGAEGRMKTVWSHDLALPGDGAEYGPQPWMKELARMLILKDLPLGVIVGSAVVEKVTQGDEFYEWHLGGVERAKKLRKPTGHPQPVWFTPF
jgi:hypothetical protein